MDGPGAAGRGYTRGLKAWGMGRAQGHITVVAPCPGLHGPNITPQKYISQGQKKPVCPGRGFLAVPWVPDGSWMRRSVDGSLPKATVI